MAILRVLKGRAPHREYTLELERAVLGRDIKSDIYLEQKDISRAHAAFLREQEAYFVVDLDSHNHTYLNGKQLEPERPYELQNNDLIKICNFIFAYQEDPSESWLDAPHTDSAETVEIVNEADTHDDSSFASELDSSSGSWQKRLHVNPEAKLRALMQISKELHEALATDQVLSRVLDSLLRVFPQAECAAVVFPPDSRPDSWPTMARCREKGQPRLKASRQVVLDVMNSQRAIVMEEADDGKLAEEGQGTRSVMSAPLVDLDGQSRGVLQLIAARENYHFNVGDLDLLSIVTRQIAFAIEDSKLYEKALQKRTVQRDLQLAREIQLGLLPGESPQIEGYDFYDHYAPASEVGGDYYDYVMLSESRLAVIVGDVSGKGVPAALLMAKLASEVRVFLTSAPSVAEVLSRINSSFGERVPEGSFVTMVIMVLDFESNRADIVNAGHIRPLHLSDGTVYSLGNNEVGCPLGVLPQQSFESIQLSVEPGDSLVLFSDGVSDAKNEQGQRYRLEGLKRQMLATDEPAAPLGPRIIRDLGEFVGLRPQEDDICLVCITRK